VFVSQVSFGIDKIGTEIGRIISVPFFITAYCKTCVKVYMSILQFGKHVSHQVVKLEIA
jgi:hypothetical protein